MKGLVLDLRSNPGGLLNSAVAVSAAFLPKNALVVYTDGRTEDAKMRLTATKENYVRGAFKDDYLAQAARGREDGADGRARERRLGVGLRDRRGRAAGPQARDRHRHADLRQGLGADDPAAAQQPGGEAHHGALLHAGRPLDPGQGHRARHRGRGRGRHARRCCAKPTCSTTSRSRTTSRAQARRRKGAKPAEKIIAGPAAGQSATAPRAEGGAKADAKADARTRRRTRTRRRKTCSSTPRSTT